MSAEAEYCYLLGIVKYMESVLQIIPYIYKVRREEHLEAYTLFVY